MISSCGRCAHFIARLFTPRVQSSYLNKRKIKKFVYSIVGIFNDRISFSHGLMPISSAFHRTEKVLPARRHFVYLLNFLWIFLSSNRHSITSKRIFIYHFINTYTNDIFINLQRSNYHFPFFFVFKLFFSHLQIIH